MADAPHVRPIPSSGETLPVIGLGTWQTFDVQGRSAQAPLEACVADFAALGGRVVDSSPMYGRAESVVGDIVTKLGIRDRLFIATKVWTSGRRQGVEQMESSMRKLGVDRLDLMQVHNLVDAGTHLATLRDWQAAGRVRYIGVTHYAASSHDAVARVLRTELVDAVQINYSVAEPEADRTILPLALDRGVAVIANRPFGGGATIRRLRGRAVPVWAADIGCTTWAALLLKWVVAHPAITCAIPATAQVAHLRDNMQAAFGPLPDAAMRARIADAVR